jgi:phage-related protein
VSSELSGQLKQIIWIGSSLKDLRGFPREVQDVVGYALFEVQLGTKPACAKPFRIGEGSGAGVLEIVEDFDTNTYRAVYTVRFREYVYVLHCFQKKSKRGIATPKQDVNLIKERLKRAEEDYRNRRGH